MSEPRKWRDTIDPFSIGFKNFQVIKVLGYPHARSDVFYVKGIWNAKNIYAYIKYARNDDINFSKEIAFIKNKKIPNRAKVIDYDINGKYIVTKAIRGKRLTQILKENKSLNSLSFLEHYGEKLAYLHKLDIKCDEVDDRKFFHVVNEEYAKKYDLVKFREYLIKNKPEYINKCFCHGDMHYANVLWKDTKIVAILDYELAGIGNKEFDIAWCIIRRPGQKFMTSQEELECFFRGYLKVNECNKEYVKYYMGVIYLYFYEIGINDNEYKEYVYSWLNDNLK